MHDKSAAFDRESGNQGSHGASLPEVVRAVSAAVSTHNAGVGKPAGPINAGRLAALERRSSARAFLNGREAAELLGLSERRWAQVRHEAWCPLPVMLGERSLRWVRAELIEAAATLAPRTGVRPEPPHLSAARARSEAV